MPGQTVHRKTSTFSQEEMVLSRKASAGWRGCSFPPHKAGDLSSDLSEVREEGEPRIWKYIDVSHLDEGSRQ